MLVVRLVPVQPLVRATGRLLGSERSGSEASQRATLPPPPRSRPRWSVLLGDRRATRWQRETRARLRGDSEVAASDWSIWSRQRHMC